MTHEEFPAVIIPTTQQCLKVGIRVCNEAGVVLIDDESLLPEPFADLAADYEPDADGGKHKANKHNRRLSVERHTVFVGVCSVLFHRDFSLGWFGAMQDC